MRLDASGFPEPTGEFEDLPADAVVLALGQEAELSLLDGVAGIEVEDGVVRVGPGLMTGYPGIFAGGDMVPADRTVTVAIGHGKKAARGIDAWLRGALDYCKGCGSACPSARAAPSRCAPSRSDALRGGRRLPGRRGRSAPRFALIVISASLQVIGCLWGRSGPFAVTFGTRRRDFCPCDHSGHSGTLGAR
jgi:hypothetical protein